jgi:hypothetical protein
MCLIDEKACVRSHLHISTFQTCQCYWLILNHRYMLTEEWTHRISEAVKPSFSLFFKFFPPFITWIKKIIIKFKFRENMMFLTMVVVFDCDTTHM